MKTVRSVERAVAILFLVAENEQPLGLSDISRFVGLDKATALRLLNTMEGVGLIQQDAASRRYILGPRVGQLFNSWRSDLRHLSRPHLERLLKSTGEAVCLVCPRGLERIVVEALNAKYELCVVPTIGGAAPIHVGAAGKVIMSHMSEADVERIIELTGLRPVTKDSIIDRDVLVSELAEIRRLGYGISMGETLEGGASVAAPVLDHDGHIVGATAINGPQLRLTRERLIQLAPLVIQTAQGVSRDLGHRPPKATVTSLR